jgi:hypothetical protein
MRRWDTEMKTGIFILCAALLFAQSPAPAPDPNIVAIQTSAAALQAEIVSLQGQVATLTAQAAAGQKLMDWMNSQSSAELLADYNANNGAVPTTTVGISPTAVLVSWAPMVVSPSSSAGGASPAK